MFVVCDFQFVICDFCDPEFLRILKRKFQYLRTEKRLKISIWKNWRLDKILNPRNWNVIQLANWATKIIMMGTVLSTCASKY